MSLLSNHGLIETVGIQFLGARSTIVETLGNVTNILPDGTYLAGDLIIGFHATRTSSHTPVQPSGFTVINSDVDSGNFWRQMVSYKICVGGELAGDTITFSYSSGLLSIKPTILVHFRKTNGFESGGLTNGNGTLTHSNITTTVAGSVAIAFYTYVANNDDSVMAGATGGAWIKPLTRVGLTSPTTLLHLSANFQYSFPIAGSSLTGGSSSLPNLNMNRSFAIKQAA